MSHVRVMKNDLARKVLARTVAMRLWFRTASLRPWFHGLAALLTVLGMGWQAAHAEISAPPSPQTIDAPALAAWADREFGGSGAANRYSALALVVVSGDQVILDRTYGYANWVTREPVDSFRTEFLIGSITKTFTATAVAQLLERGQIASLDEPVNKYLKRVQLPPPYGDQVTFWHLLTHSAGFEVRNAGLAALEAQRRPLTPEALRSVAAEIAHPPGQYSLYANAGAGLLAVLVEDVTGRPIDQYMQENIFNPLGMHHTRINLSPERPEALVHAYRLGQGTSPEELGWLPFSAYAGPIGGISATPQDMTQYIKAHLGTGEFAGRNILQPQTLAKMHAPHFGNHPAVNQFGMQFFTGSWNGRRLVEHGGNWPYNISMLTLVPEEKLGIFIATVGDATGGARFMPAWEVRARLLTRLFGAQAYEMQPGAAAPLDEYVGRYQQLQRNHSTLEALLDLIAASSGDAATNDFVMRVTEDGRGGLRIAGVDGYLPIGGDRFWKKDFTPGPDWAGPLYAFTRNAEGRLTGLVHPFGVDMYQRVSVFADLGTRGRWALGLALVLLSGLAAVFWRAKSRVSSVGRLMAMLGALTIVAMPLVVLAFHGPGGIAYYLLSAQPGRWAVFALLANFLIVVTAVVAWSTVEAWRSSAAGWREHLARWHGAVLALAGAGLVVILGSVNALGLHLP